MEEEKEEVGGKEEQTSVKVSKKAHELIVTLQSLRQIEKGGRVSVSEVLCDALTREIKRMREIEK